MPPNSETASPEDQVILIKRAVGLFTHKLHSLAHQKGMETEQKIQLNHLIERSLTIH